MNAFIVDLKNKPGELAKVAGAIADKGINITGFSGATCGDTGSVVLLTADEAGTRRPRHRPTAARMVPSRTVTPCRRYVRRPAETFVRHRPNRPERAISGYASRGPLASPNMNRSLHTEPRRALAHPTGLLGGKSRPCRTVFSAKPQVRCLGLLNVVRDRSGGLAGRLPGSRASGTAKPIFASTSGPAGSTRPGMTPRIGTSWACGGALAHCS